MKYQICTFLNWDSPRVRLNSHYETWSLKKKKYKKINIQEICLERSYRQKVPVNSRFKAIQIIGQRKVCYRQSIPRSIPEQRKKQLTKTFLKNRSVYQNNEQTSLERKEVELVEPVQMNTRQSIEEIYRKDLG